MSFLYCYAKQAFLGRGSLSNEAVYQLTLSTSMFAMLVASTHTADQNASTTGSLRSVFASRSRADNSVTADVALSSNEVSSSNGITFFDAADFFFGAAGSTVTSGNIFASILLYQRKTNDTDSIPVALITINTTTANGSTINVNWDNGVNRIFALTG